MLVTNPFSPGSWTRAQVNKISSGWWILLANGIFSAAAGAIIVFTDWSVADLAFAVGFVLAFRGFFTVFSPPIDGSSQWWSVVVGLLEIGVGIAVWTWPGPTLLVIAAWIGWLLLFRGVMAVSGAVVARRILPFWGFVAGLGILEVAASFYLLARPGLTLVATILAVGLTVMFYGLAEIAVAFKVKNLPRRLSKAVGEREGRRTQRLESATA